MLHRFHELAMMTMEEKHCLYEISKNLSPNSIVLEVGTYQGGSCSVVADSNPNIKIHTIDIFEDPNFSYYDITKRLSVFDNVTVHRGNSFVNFKDWNLEIDLYIEDGAHEDPVLNLSINQWIKYLKIGGLIAIHDSGIYFPDVKKNIDLLLKTKKYEFIKQIGSLTVLKRVE
jgi:predicted O-methyltransferase YrrM